MHMVELKRNSTPISEGYQWWTDEQTYSHNPQNMMHSIIQPSLIESKQKAVVVDIDGVMNHITSDGVLQKDGTFRKKMFDLVKSINDLPKGEMLKRLHSFYLEGYKIIFLTYRTEDQRIVTDQFLQQSLYFNYTLFMLPNSMALATPAQFKVWVIKELCQPYFKVEHFFDDDKETVQKVAELGIKSHLVDRT